MATKTAVASPDVALLRLREEFVSMPGMRLNVLQVARLLSVDAACAAHLLEELEAEGLLVGIAGGVYRRSAPLLS